MNENKKASGSKKAVPEAVGLRTSHLTPVQPDTPHAIHHARLMRSLTASVISRQLTWAKYG